MFAALRENLWLQTWFILTEYVRKAYGYTIVLVDAANPGWNLHVHDPSKTVTSMLHG